MKEVGKKQSRYVGPKKDCNATLCIMQKFSPVDQVIETSHSLPEGTNKTKHNSSIMGLFKPADPGSPSSSLL
jgi:hypothetical protein